MDCVEKVDGCRHKHLEGITRKQRKRGKKDSTTQQHRSLLETFRTTPSSNTSLHRAQLPKWRTLASIKDRTTPQDCRLYYSSHLPCFLQAVEWLMMIHQHKNKNTIEKKQRSRISSSIKEGREEEEGCTKSSLLLSHAMQLSPRHPDHKLLSNFFCTQLTVEENHVYCYC